MVQLYRLFGSIDILGNPASLIENMVKKILTFFNNFNFYKIFIIYKKFKFIYINKKETGIKDMLWKPLRDFVRSGKFN